MSAPTTNLAELAVFAQQMPWETSPADIPYEAKVAFRNAMTPALFLELLDALQALLQDVGPANSLLGAIKARAAIAKATGETS